MKVTLLYDSDDSGTPVGSIVFSSDEGLPLSPGQDDRRKVCKRNSSFIRDRWVILRRVGCLVVVLVLVSAFLHVEVSVKLVRVFLG